MAPIDRSSLFHRSTSPVYSIDRRLLCGFRNLVFAAFIFIYSVVAKGSAENPADQSWTFRTCPSGCRMRTISCYFISLLPLKSPLVIFMVWCLLHDRYTPHHNSIRPFGASVLLMSVRQDDMSPLDGNACWQKIWNGSWLWIYTFIVSNSSK